MRPITSNIIHLSSFCVASLFVLLNISSAQAAVTQIEAVSAVSNGAGNITANFGTATNSGELITVAAVTGLDGNTPTTVTDNKGDTYAKVYGITGIRNHYSSNLYYLANAPAGITTITVMEDGDVSGGVIAAHYMGVATANPLDVFSAPNTAGSATPWVSGAITTNQANELLVGSVFATNGTANCTVAASGNWTQDSLITNGALDGANGGAMAYAHQIVYAIQTNIQDTGTNPAGNCMNYAGIAAFKSASTGTTSTLTLTNSGSGSVTSNPSGINCGTTCSMVVNDGTNVTLTATPTSGYVTTWSSCGSTTSGNTCTLAVNANTTVSAAFNPPDTPPSIPTNLSATAVSTSQIDLTWTASTDNIGVTGYTIYRNGTQVGTSVSPSYNDTGLAASTQYTYNVSAYDAAGNASAQSASASATTEAASTSGDTTFYIAANGSDSNSGTSKSSAWLHAPGMPNCNANCAAMNPEPGDRYIFRGGDTWHFGNPNASPYTGGTWGWGVIAGNNRGLPPFNGTNGNPIYIGVDQAWYSGDSWSRPIFSGDNPTSTSPVTSCSYQSGPTNALLDFSQTQYVVVDDFELTGLCESDANDAKADLYLNTNDGDWGGNNLFEHLYIHGWTTVPFSCSGINDQGVCINIGIFRGGTQDGIGGDELSQNVVDGGDSAPGSAMLLFGGGYNVSQNVFRYVAQVVATDIHVWHDNLMEHWYEPGDGAAHGNLLEDSGNWPTSIDAMYNNVFRDICTDPGSCPAGIVGIWPDPDLSTTEYIFDNVGYDEQSVEYLNAGQNNQDQGHLVLFNNTFEYGAPGYSIVSCSATGNYGPLTTVNNHFIYDGTSPYGSNCNIDFTAGSPMNDSTMSHVAASGEGYTSVETYAYSPASSGGATVGAGTNEQSFCNTMLESSDPLVHAAGVACESDTTYGVGYNMVTHTVIIPNRATVLRPTTGAWDAGAYQYSSASLPPQGTAPSVTSALTANVTVDTPFSYEITGSQSPTSYNASNLPTGLSVDPTTGIISGTPAATGTTNVTISASNQYGTGTATLTIVVASPTTPPTSAPSGGGGSSSSGGGGGGGSYIPPVASTTTTSSTTTISVVSTAGMSIAQMESLLASLETELNTLEAKAGGGSPSYLFMRNLFLGSEGIDVKALQHYLNIHGFPITTTPTYAGSLGYETEYFGTATERALALFQKSVGISPASGFFGPKTRSYLETVTGK